MKKTNILKKNKNLSFLFFSVCLFLFNAGCGLDVYSVVKAPEYVEHMPNYESSFENANFQFQTEENIGNSDVDFRGTNVYYKIYNSYSRMTSQVSSITSYISSTDNKAKAINQLLESCKFQQLKLKDSNDAILISNSSKGNQKVRIRLTDYNDEDDEEKDEDFASGLRIADILQKNGDEVIPVVRVNNDLSFNFGRYRTQENAKVPEEGDEDVDISSSASEDDEHKWYVPLFAVGIALQNDYSYNYSCPLYLGCVTIDDRETKN